MDILPSPYYEFFVYLEPFLTVIGMLWGLINPVTYHHALTASSSLVPPSSAAIMAIRQLANVFSILAAMSFFVLPQIAQINTVSALYTIRAFLGILGLADLTHIAWTLYDLGSLRYQPSSWNSMIHGNTTLVVVLFAWRAMWMRYSERVLREGRLKKA